MRDASYGVAPALCGGSIHQRAEGIGLWPAQFREAFLEVLEAHPELRQHPGFVQEWAKCVHQGSATPTAINSILCNMAHGQRVPANIETYARPHASGNIAAFSGQAIPCTFQRFCCACQWMHLQQAASCLLLPMRVASGYGQACKTGTQVRSIQI